MIHELTASYRQRAPSTTTCLVVFLCLAVGFCKQNSVSKSALAEATQSGEITEVGIDSFSDGLKPSTR